jgi:hypothetical protein
VRILGKTKESNQIAVEPIIEGNIVKIHFDYLDHNHGVVLQVLHTGLGNDDIAITGDIMGIKAIEQIVGKGKWNIFPTPPLFERMDVNKLRISRKIFAIIFMIYSFLTMFYTGAYFLIKTFVSYKTYSAPLPSNNLSISIALILTTVISGIMFIETAIVVFRKAVPNLRGIEIYQDEIPN